MTWPVVGLDPLERASLSWWLAMPDHPTQNQHSPAPSSAQRKNHTFRPNLTNISDEATAGNQNSPQASSAFYKATGSDTANNVQPTSFPTHSSPSQMSLILPATEEEVKRFELFRSVIQHEDDLLNQRVSWILLAQSFLMAAYITNVSQDGSGNALKYITAIVGLLTIVVTMPAILAAGRNIELQQHVYFSKISSDQRCRELHGHGRSVIKVRGGDSWWWPSREENSKLGTMKDLEMEEQLRARVGHIFPTMSFRGRGAVPILFTVIALMVVQVGGWFFLLAALMRNW